MFKLPQEVKMNCAGNGLDGVYEAIVRRCAQVCNAVATLYTGLEALSAKQCKDSILADFGLTDKDPPK
jgi:hypothetical protein